MYSITPELKLVKLPIRFIHLILIITILPFSLFASNDNLSKSEEVNGYRLPPEPDEQLNNSTLLGIDSNGNGVRDDVERLIIIEEAKNPHFPKIQTAISLQYAWAWQKVIINPTLQNKKYLDKYFFCVTINLDFVKAKV